MKKGTVLNIIRYVTLTASVFCLFVAVIFMYKFARDSANTKAPSVPIEVEHRVLFLSSYSPLYFTYAAQVAGLEKSLYENGIEYDVVYMDAKRYGTEKDIADFYNFLSERLKVRNDYEAILLGDDNALLFALEYQDELFRDLPLVFFGINDLSLAERAALNPKITGFYENDYLKQTIELAIKLFPQSKTIVALHDESVAGRADKEIFMSYQSRYPDWKFVDLNSAFLTQDELILKLESLSKDSILIYMTCYSDVKGNVYSMLSRTNTVVKHTQVPIFRNYVGGEGLGILGGIYMDFEEQCFAAGRIICDVLSGADISAIPLNTNTPSRSAFDYSLMQKYKLDFSLLPANTVFYNRPQTFFEQYGKIMPVAILVTVALLFLLLSFYISLAIMRTVNQELKTSHNDLVKSQEKLKYQAEHDDFLDITNRRTATEYLRKNLLLNQVYSILMADIDGFKLLNETFGHQVSDEILKMLTLRLKMLAEQNAWFIARYGGDEFLFLIPKEHLNIKHSSLKKIVDTINSPLQIGGETITLTASIGISNSDGITIPDQHIINAEAAMYEAKNRGRNGAFLYGDEMKEKVRKENNIKAKLLEAFENDGFYMLFQPKVNAQTKLVNGFEALVRMKEPGMYPSDFIPIAEQNGWIWRIGRITTELTIKQLADWQSAGHTLYPVSVNFSSNQLNDTGYIDFLHSLLQKYKIPAKLVEIEITEGLFLEKTAQADQLFKRFKDLGIRLLMDDFGTGYSSLGYLSYIPVDVIKLDKSLVDAYLVDGKDLFIRDVIQLMHDLDKEMIIEGVEEEWQFERLKKFGADTIQGYYFSKPLPQDQAITFKV